MSEWGAADELKQVVRKALPGELLPFYSTSELLLGARHAVPMSDAQIKANDARNLAAARATVAREKRREVDADKRFALVKKMLEDHNTAHEIAVALKITVKSAQRYVIKHPELIELAKINPRYGRHDKNSLGRFMEQEASIREALKTEAFWFVAARFRFGQKTLKRHLGMS